MRFFDREITNGLAQNKLNLRILIFRLHQRITLIKRTNLLLFSEDFREITNDIIDIGCRGFFTRYIAMQSLQEQTHSKFFIIPCIIYYYSRRTMTFVRFNDREIIIII